MFGSTETVVPAAGGCGYSHLPRGKKVMVAATVAFSATNMSTDFTSHLDITHIEVHYKIYAPKKNVKMT